MLMIGYREGTFGRVRGLGANVCVGHVERAHGQCADTEHKSGENEELGARLPLGVLYR